MRLSSKEQHAIKDLFEEFSENGKIYLFGSRVDNSLKGGDIDLLIISKTFEFSDKVNFLANLKDKIGEQKIDIIVLQPNSLDNNSFYDEIKNSLVKL